MRSVRSRHLIVVLLWCSSGVVAQPDLQPIGHLVNRRSPDIASSPWGIQIGSLDPELVARAADIGVKWTRLNAGWTSIERDSGKYSWEDTDTAFKTAARNGITPFVTLVGAHPAYCATRENADPGLREIYGTRPLPPTSSAVALSGWLRFVRATVTRYKHMITYWEIWNEPNHFAYWGDEPNPEEYGRLVRETAVAIKQIDPNAQVLAGSLAGLDPDFVRSFLDQVDVGMVDVVTFHNYGSIPEERIYKGLAVLDVLANKDRSLRLWQGECGYPSHSSTRDFRGSSPWGPTIQAKWLLRQAFVDTYYLKAEVSNYFKLYHEGGRGQVPKRSFLSPVDSILGFPERGGARVKGVGVNEKCLLSNPDLRPKPGFAAYQNLCALIDGRYRPQKALTSVEILDQGIFYGIGKEDDAFPSIPLVATYVTHSGSLLMAYWLPWHPQELIRPAAVRISLLETRFKDPVLVDLLDGTVRSLTQVVESGPPYVFSTLPLSDYPLIIAERDQVELLQ